MHNGISVIVGLESCMDCKAGVSIKTVRRLSKSTKSGLKKELLIALRALSRGTDGEIAADGKNVSALLSEIKAGGAKIATDLGGNPAIAASQLISLGTRVHFVGNIFRREKEMLSSEAFFKKCGFGFSEELDSAPISLVLEHESSRFIICEGRGRRINDLRECIAQLPEIVPSIGRKEKISAIYLPSWHVVFANGITEKDASFLEKTLEKIRKTGILMFTDTGSFGRLKDSDVAKLWRIYGMFDVIGMNEFEFQRLCDTVLGIKNEKKDRIHSRLAALLQSCRAHTIWLHTKDFQASVSKKISASKLGNAEENASAAGVLRIEEDGYPAEKMIRIRKKTGGRIRDIPDVRMSGVPQGMSFSMTPCDRLRHRIKSEAGAGDVSAATYLWSLLSLQNHSE